MSTPYPVQLAGEELWLLPEKAIYWPAQQALLIADVHFGKAALTAALANRCPKAPPTAISPCSMDYLATLPAAS